MYCGADKRGVPLVARVLLGLTLLNLLGAQTGPSGSRQLELRLYVGKAQFFEQEPIYTVLELSNNGLDTAWVSPFGITFPALNLVLTDERGSPVPQLVGVSDYYPAPGWRGIPIAPGNGLYATTLLQDSWGAADSAAQGLFIRHLSPGAYDLNATYVSEVGAYAGRAQPVHFSIRERTRSEDGLYREVKGLTGMASDRQQRAQYLGALLTWVSTRLAAKDSANPYLAFVLHNGVQIAKAAGSWPDSTSAARLASLRATVADAQRWLPAGAYAVDAGYADRPDVVPILSQTLGPSLAASVAAQREKEQQKKAKPRQ